MVLETCREVMGSLSAGSGQIRKFILHEALIEQMYNRY
jgi:hypothetical protein